MRFYAVQFAQAYGEGAYGSGTYSCSAQQQAAGTCTVGSTNNGGLADTGIAIVGIVTLACLLIFVTLTVRIWRRKKTPEPAAQEAAADEDQKNSTVPSK